MFCTSTHKSDWIFDCVETLQCIRAKVNSDFRRKYNEVLQPGEENNFFDIDVENTMHSIVQETGIKFGDYFQVISSSTAFSRSKPALWPSVRWIAFAYYKRFFLSFSSLEFSPKHVMTSCYYLATKTDEFYVPVNEFVQNLQTGTPEKNIAAILTLEPVILKHLKYSLVVHTPYRALEGHIMDIKVKMVLLNFDVESLRPSADDFLIKCLMTDVMLLYSPAQISLAAIKYALATNDKSLDLMKEFIMKVFDIEENEWKRNEKDMEKVDKLNSTLDDIRTLVGQQSQLIEGEMRKICMKRYFDVGTLVPVLEERRRLNLNESAVSMREENFDSDDEFS